MLVWIAAFVSCGMAVRSTPEDEVKAEQKETLNLSGYQRAYFASGCFWCVEAIYESVDGVVEVVSGYSGGKEENPTYEQVGAGRTSHAEAVVVYYDSTRVDFATLVDVYYGSQDPTTVNGQHPDYGRQYRSIIFYTTALEKEIAEQKKAEQASRYDAPIATEIIQFERFWEAEAYHQNYEKLHPENPYVQRVSIPRLKRFQQAFPHLLKK